MNRQEKQDNVAAYKAIFEESEFLAITHYRGLTVSQISELRAELRKEDAAMQVTKNSLARIAIKGTAFDELSTNLNGPTALVTSQNPVATAKVLAKFAEDNDNFEIIAGGLGQIMMDANGLQALSKMPSLEELKGKLVALLQTPAQRLAVVLQAPAAQLARVTKAHAEQG